jgi:hypothetical protein
MLPYMSTAQFMLSTVTGFCIGQKKKNQMGVRKRSEPMLIAKPHRPSDHRRGGRSSPRMRFKTKQAMVM